MFGRSIKALETAASAMQEAEVLKRDLANLSGRIQGAFDEVCQAVNDLRRRMDALEKAKRTSVAQREGGALKLGEEASLSKNAGMEIDYISGEADETRRVVIPMKAHLVREGRNLKPAGFEAFCTLRKAMRSFYMDRIKEAFDAETGEKIDPAEWIMKRVE